jgi:metal-sulfur cluster biosynthetic enzyme
VRIEDDYLATEQADGIRSAASMVSGVAGVETRLVWDPGWHPGMIALGALPG